MLTKDTFALNLQRQLKKSRNGVPSRDVRKLWRRKRCQKLRKKDKNLSTQSKKLLN